MDENELKAEFDTKDEYMTSRQVREELGLTKNQLAYLMRRDGIKADLRVSHYNYFLRSTVDHLVAMSRKAFQHSKLLIEGKRSAKNAGRKRHLSFAYRDMSAVREDISSSRGSSSVSSNERGVVAGDDDSGVVRSSSSGFLVDKASLSKIKSSRVREFYDIEHLGNILSKLEYSAEEYVTDLVKVIREAKSSYDRLRAARMLHDLVKSNVGLDIRSRGTAPVLNPAAESLSSGAFTSDADDLVNFYKEKQDEQRIADCRSAVEEAQGQAGPTEGPGDLVEQAPDGPGEAPDAAGASDDAGEDTMASGLSKARSRVGDESAAGAQDRAGAGDGSVFDCEDGDGHGTGDGA